MNRNEVKISLIKVLQSFPGHLNRWEVYFDWIHAMAYTLANVTDRSHLRHEREVAYMKLVDKYGNNMHKFSECLALLVRLFEYQSRDWLGEIYMEGEFSNKHLGQFFTPYHVSKLMADLTFDEDQLKKKRKIGFYEPTVGAGGMIIALAETMKEKGYNPQTQLEVYCTDLDTNALLMAFVQLSILGIPARCEVKNALSMDQEDCISQWYTPGWFMFRRIGLETSEYQRVDKVELEQLVLEI